MPRISALGYQEQSQGHRLLQKSWGERSWEATCPDSRWGWLEPQEDVGGPQVGVSPQRPAAESGGGGVTGRSLRGGTGGPASRRAPSTLTTATSTYLHFLEQVEHPPKMLGGTRHQGPPLASSPVNPSRFMGLVVASCGIGWPSQAGSSGIRRVPPGWISSFRMEPRPWEPPAGPEEQTCGLLQSVCTIFRQKPSRWPVTNAFLTLLLTPL